MDAAKRGNDALAAKNYQEAIASFTQALKTSPTSPAYYINRSTAYQRITPPDYPNALYDAEKAVILAMDRAKRELIVQAQLRRVIALFGLERYGDADFVLGVVTRMDPKEKSAALWQNKIQSKLSNLDPADAKAEVTVKETPDFSSQAEATQTSAPAVSTATDHAAGTAALPSTAAAPTQTPANKIRHDWYQNSENVYFTLLAKGAPQDQTTVDIREQSLSISFPTGSGSTFEFSLDPLYSLVDVAASSSKISSTKIEVVFRKRQPGIKWHSLEGSLDSPPNAASIASIPAKTADGAVVTGPAYPTSSRSGTKDWDKLATELTAKKKKKPDDKSSASKTGDAKQSTDDDDWDYEADENGDAVQGFFQKLYKDASPDVQRAMMKSYTESNGTSLSTNWEDVKKKKVETLPPDGMVAKPWQS